MHDLIGEMEAGRELDALVAKKIMGWCQEYAFDLDGSAEPMWKEPEYLVPPNSDEARRVPFYSTDIAAAWDVVEMMITMAYGFELEFQPFFWQCRFSTGPLSSFMGANTVPLAICRAALKDIGVKKVKRVKE